MSRLGDVRRFYRLLANLEQRTGGLRRLSDCNGRLNWSSHGVYFFFDATEPRTTSGVGPRVVRVGTHALTIASHATLWKRLSIHRGSVRTGGGNHRASIFRQLVGEALILRDRHDVPTWGRGSTSSAAAQAFDVARQAVLDAERDTETAVSRRLGELPFVCLPTAPEARDVRAYMERNSIALLSNLDRPAIDPPSTTWLGQHSSRDLVRRSGLWNNNHVNETHEPAFLDELERRIDALTRAR